MFVAMNAKDGKRFEAVFFCKGYKWYGIASMV